MIRDTHVGPWFVYLFYYRKTYLVTYLDLAETRDQMACERCEIRAHEVVSAPLPQIFSSGAFSRNFGDVLYKNTKIYRA